MPTRIDKTLLAYKKLQIEIRLLQVSIDRQNKRLDRLQQSATAIRDTVHDLKSRQERDREAAEVRLKLIAEREHEIVAAQAKLEADNYEIDIKQADAEAAYERSKDLYGYAKEATNESTLLAYLGGFMLLIGFLGWYFLVQRYQDEILQRQALALRAVTPTNQSATSSSTSPSANTSSTPPAPPANGQV